MPPGASRRSKSGVERTAPSSFGAAPVRTSSFTVASFSITSSSTFFVSIVSGNTESDDSLTARYVYDAAPPKVTITTPKNNANCSRSPSAQ